MIQLKIITKQLSAACLTLTLLTATPARSESCQEIVQACDQVVEAADARIAELGNLILMQDAVIKADDDLIKALQHEAQVQREKASAWYRQPEIVAPLALTAGLVAGILLVK